jgi:hypothetical protein
MRIRIGFGSNGTDMQSNILQQLEIENYAEIDVKSCEAIYLAKVRQPITLQSDKQFCLHSQAKDSCPGTYL